MGKCPNPAIDETKRVMKFKKGDVVVWDSDMLHKTQPVKQAGFQRMNYFARLVDADATMCATHMMRSTRGSNAPCSIQKEKDPLQSACFPQIYPNVLKDELSQHFGDIDKPMVLKSVKDFRYIWNLEICPVARKVF